MNLPGQDDPFRVEAHAPGENPDIFLHIFQGIPPAHGEVEAFKAAGAHTAQAGGERVGNGNFGGNKIFKRIVFFCSNHRS